MTSLTPNGLLNSLLLSQGTPNNDNFFVVVLCLVLSFFLMYFTFLWLSYSVNLISFPFDSVFTIDLQCAFMPSSDCSPLRHLCQALWQPHHSSHNSFWSFNFIDVINSFSKISFTMKCAAWTGVAILEKDTWFVTSVESPLLFMKSKLKVKQTQNC